jgi:hypothetical protein
MCLADQKLFFRMYKHKNNNENGKIYFNLQVIIRRVRMETRKMLKITRTKKLFQYTHTQNLRNYLP